MKKLLLACALMGSIAASAQPGSGHPQRPDPEAHAAQLQKVLQLSDEQTAKVKKVFESGAQQNQALREKYKPQFEAFRVDMMKQREQTQSQIKAVLTPAQQKAFETLHDQRGGMMGKRGRHDDDCPMRGGDDDDHGKHH